jgi:DNA polymerase elongation subunit (family B)
MEKQKLLERKKQLEKEISRYNNIQLAKKEQLNSAYGALGNKYFRFFDVRMAESITLSGQLSIRWIENKINEYLNSLLETENEDYVIASDTDSLYIKFDALVKKSFGDKLESTPKEKIVDFLDKVSSKKIKPYIDKCYQELSVRMNAYQQKMSMKRESIADKGIWTAKKRYFLNVYDNEGVRYETPKLKIMGIEAIKSSTPSSCRKKMKELFQIIINKDEDAVQKFISEYREEFSSTPFEEIAFPRSVSDITKYYVESKDLIIQPSTPIHVRGSLVYNHLIRKMNLSKKYEMIKDGEKIKFCYLKIPNSVGQNVISVLSTLPEEFSLNKYIDYDLQFEKAFVEPIKIILNCIGWNVEKQNTIENFFV